MNESATKDGLPPAIWNIHYSNVGEQPAHLKKINSSQGAIILVQCDRPALYFENRDHL